MFKALKEFAQGDKLIQAGDLVETATTRMIELGLVEPITSEVQEVKEVQAPKAEKPKKEKKAKEETKVEEVKVEEVQILTEDSADVTVETVEKTEE